MRPSKRKKQMIVHYEEGRNQIALFEDGQLVEFAVERPIEREPAGNIYKGRVVNVLPGMEAAFVDIGLEKNAFLHLEDVLPAHLEKKPKVAPLIADLLRVGQTIHVQVKKEPYGSKGARVTTHFTIPGRWIVLLPEANYVAISKKIKAESERSRLREIGERLRMGEEGIIIRTVAENESNDAIEQDLLYLRGIWQEIKSKIEAAHNSPHSLIYRDIDMIPRMIRDLFTEEVEEIVVDQAELADHIRFMLQELSPLYADRVHLYKGNTAIYDAYAVSAELEKAFRNKIWLPSGGYVVLDRTEALIVIDVNTGKFVGERQLEQTVFETNLEAVHVITRLLRLRDLSGIIIIDFIDMQEEGHRRSIVQKLEELCAHDRTKTHIAGWTKLGLVELTRKKVRQTIEGFIKPQ